MSFLEILFIINLLLILVTWGWFIFLGFRANKAWGFSIIFLSPITPFMFASRFARKSRKAIYYYVITLVAFILLTAYIHFSTIYFYKNFWGKMYQESSTSKIEKQTAVIEKILPKEDQKISLEINEERLIDAPTIIEESSDIEERIVPPVIKVEPRKESKKRSYKVVNITTMGQYINKRIIITTAVTTHKGKLSSTTASTLLIKKRSSNGSVVMPIKKSKIIKIEVYL